MIRSRSRPMTSHATAPRPQLTSAFLISASSPANCLMPSSREKTPGRRRRLRPARRRPGRCSGWRPARSAARPPRATSAHSAQTSQTSWATRVADRRHNCSCAALLVGRVGVCPGHASSLDCVPRVGVRRSAPDEGRLARSVLNERRHAVDTVLGREDCRELLALDLQAGVEVDLDPPVDALLGGADGVAPRPR